MRPAFSREYLYDSAGDLTRYVDRNGVVRDYRYDSEHRVIGETWYPSDADAGQNAANEIEYAYDEAGRIVYEADAGSSVSYTYNDAGQITSTTSSSDGAPTVTLDYAYDADGNRTRMSATVDGVADFVEDYAYDDSGRVISVVQHGVDGGNAVAEKELVLDYDDEGRIISIDRYQDGQLAVEADYAYDERGRLISLLYHQGGTTLASYAWKYTDSGEPLLLEGTSNADWTPNGGLPSEFVDQGMLPVHDTDGVVDALMAGGYADLSRLVSCTSLDGTVTYSYDPTGQLTGADYSDESTPDESYTYDANGNRVTTNGYVYTTGPDNRLLSDGTYWYDYDAEGNRVARFIDVNVNGILDSGDTDVTKYTWDARNRLIHVADYPVEGASPEQMVDHVYDLENRWIGRLVDVDGDGTIDHRTAFVYDGNQIVLEFENNGAPDLAATDLSHRYLWQPDAIDQIMADEQFTSPDAEGDIVWPLGDHLGTVRDLGVQHSETGETTVVNHITYDSFGNKASETNAVIDSLFGFTGRPLDDQTGLQNNVNRWYDASVGAWISNDPIGFKGLDGNPGRYLANSPTSATDASGLTPGAAAWLHGDWPGSYKPPKFPAEHDREIATDKDVVMLGGQEIGPTLTVGLLVFKKLLYRMSDEEFRAWGQTVCSRTGKGTWDIKELAEAGAVPQAERTFVVTDPHEEKDAYGTVTVRNRVHWAAEVNYILWGTFQRVILDRHNSKSDIPMPPESYFAEMGTPTIAAYRTVTHGDRLGERGTPKYRSRGIGIPGRSAWAQVGYYNSYGRATHLQLNGKRDNEPRTCIPATQLYTGALTFRAGKALGGIWTGEGVKLVIRLSRTDPGGYKYTVDECRVPGFTDPEALEIAREIVRGMDLLDE